MYHCSGWDLVSFESSIYGVWYSGCVRQPVCTPVSALYSSHESMDGIYYVYGMLARLVVCITALVGIWSALNRVYMGYVSISTSVRVYYRYVYTTSLLFINCCE